LATSVFCGQWRRLWPGIEINGKPFRRSEH
jgi:hypothetical protein